jgi:hypothetical protein
MTSLWPWFAIAGAGALHGLNPAAGWAFGAWAGRGGALPMLRALMPVAAGHVCAVLVVAVAVPIALQLGLQFHPVLAQGIAAALLFAVVARHVLGRRHACHSAPATRTAVALWSFIVGTAHSAGWMLVPALVPLCASDAAVREITASGSIALAVAAVGVHLAAMLATTAAMAAGARSALRAIRSAGLQHPDQRVDDVVPVR